MNYNQEKSTQTNKPAVQNKPVPGKDASRQNQQDSRPGKSDEKGASFKKDEESCATDSCGTKTRQ